MEVEDAWELIFLLPDVKEDPRVEPDRNEGTCY